MVFLGDIQVNTLYKGDKDDDDDNDDDDDDNNNNNNNSYCCRREIWKEKQKVKQ